MTRIADKLSQAWGRQVDLDSLIDSPDVEVIVQQNLSEIARNPSQAVEAAAAIALTQKARLEMSERRLGLSEVSIQERSAHLRGVREVDRAQLTLFENNLNQARTLVERVGETGKAADIIVINATHELRKLDRAAMVYFDGDEITRLFSILDTVPEHMRLSLYDNIRRDRALYEGLFGKLFGDDDTRLQALMAAYPPVVFER